MWAVTRVIAIVAMLVISMSGCGAQMSTAPPAPLAKGSARLVFTRPSLLYFVRGADIKINGKKKGTLGVRQRLIIDEKAGKTKITISASTFFGVKTEQKSLSLITLPGKEYIFEISPAPRPSTVHFNLLRKN